VRERARYIGGGWWQQGERKLNEQWIEKRAKETANVATANRNYCRRLMILYALLQVFIDLSSKFLVKLTLYYIAAIPYPCLNVDLHEID